MKCVLAHPHQRWRIRLRLRHLLFVGDDRTFYLRTLPAECSNGVYLGHPLDSLPRSVVHLSHLTLQRGTLQNVEMARDGHDAISYFARTNFRNSNRLFGIKQSDRLHHVYMVGQTGVGKPTLLETLAISDLMAGRGFALLDPHGDLVERIWAKVRRAHGDKYGHCENGKRAADGETGEEEAEEADCGKDGGKNRSQLEKAERHGEEAGRSHKAQAGGHGIKQGKREAREVVLHRLTSIARSINLRVYMTVTAPYLVASANRRAIHRVGVSDCRSVVWRRELVASKNVVAVGQKQNGVLGHQQWVRDPTSAAALLAVRARPSVPYHRTQITLPQFLFRDLP